MKNILYILILFTVAMQAQVAKMPADTEFFYTYGGVNFDEARDIKETPDKGYILAGTTSSFGQGNTSFYLIKTDSLGNHKWSSVQGGSQNDWAYTVQVTHDSGFFVAGYSNSFDPTLAHNYNAYYLKTDKNGQLLWQKSVLASDYTFIYGSYPMPDSGFILCGQTYANTNGGSDGYLIRINKNGDTLWTNHYGGIQDEIFNSVCVINKKIYAVGSNSSHPSDTASDGWIVKTDMNGNQLQETFISNGNDQLEVINGITPYAPNLFTICGNQTHLDTNSLMTGIVLKYDTNFTLTQDIIHQNGLQSLSPNLPPTILNKVINISYGSICVIGTKFGGNGGLGMFFLGFDINGNNYAFHDFYPVDGGSQDDYGYSGIYTSSGRVVGVGSSKSTGEYCTNSMDAGTEDFFLIRYNSDSIHTAGVIPIYNCFTDTLALSVASITKYGSNNIVSLYPNPICNNATLIIKDNSAQIYTAKIYSLLGEEVMSTNVESTKNNGLNFSSLSTGSYFLKIENQNGNLISTLKFVVIN